MIPGVKTVSLLAPVIGSLAARLIDRALFDQQTPSPPQIIQVPALHRCHCCGGFRDEITPLDSVTNEPCSTCAQQSNTTFIKENNEHLLNAPGDSSTQIHSTSTSKSPGQTRKISEGIRRSLSHSDLTSKNSPFCVSFSKAPFSEARVDDKTLAILARHLSRGILDDSRKKTFASSKDFAGVEEPWNESGSRRVTCPSSKSSKPLKNTVHQHKSKLPNKLSTSATVADFRTHRMSEPSIDEFESSSSRQVAHKR